MVGVIELFHTIDVNGDGELDWDEFAAHMMDAGLARADFSFDDLHPTTSDSSTAIGSDAAGALGPKQYAPLELPPRDPRTPLNHIKSHIQQLVLARDLDAVAYFEAGSDVVYLYSLQFDRNEGPRHLSTLRLHTAFQEHVVIGIEYVPNGRRLLVTSSVLAAGFLSVWSITDTRNPVVIRRFEASGALELPVWVPSLQCIAVSHVLLPRLAPEQRAEAHHHHFHHNRRSATRKSAGDYFRPNAGIDQPYTRGNQILLWDLSEKKPWQHTSIEASVSAVSTPHTADGERTPLVLRDAMRGVTSIVLFKWANRPLLAIGREDGVISVVDAEEARDVHEFDAHGSGVKALAYSDAVDCLASAGFHSFADETTLDVLIWKRCASTRATVSTPQLVGPTSSSSSSSSSLSMKMIAEARLRGHEAPVELLAFIDSKRQLVTVDRSETFLVFSSVMRTPTSEPWECLQRFCSLDSAPVGPRAPQTLWSMLVVPETRASDAVLITAGDALRFYDHCEVRDSDEGLLVFFTYYCSALNVIVGATSAKIMLWRADTGVLWKSFDYAAIAAVDASSKSRRCAGSRETDSCGVITAVCMDDRERKLIVGDDAGTIRVVNAVNGNVMKQLDPHSGGSAVVALAYVLHGKCVISISAASELHICDEDQPAGYYVPFGGAPPESVLFQSLRFVYKPPSTVTAMATQSDVGTHRCFSIIRAIANQALNIIVVLVHGSKGESFVQLWDFELSHTLGTCVLPTPNSLRSSSDKGEGDEEEEEITAVMLLGSSGDVVAGTSRGRVLLWPDPARASPSYRHVLEFPVDHEGSAVSSSGAILFLSTLAIEEPPSSSDSGGNGKQAGNNSDASTTSHRASSLSAKEWANIFVRSHSIDARVMGEQQAGILVVAGDDRGFVSVWVVRRQPGGAADPVKATFMTHTNVPQASSMPTTSIPVPSADQLAVRSRKSASASEKPKSGSKKSAMQHSETLVGFDTVAALFQHAKAARSEAGSAQSSSPTREQPPSERLEAVLTCQWRAHDEAIASLELASDPCVALTSSSNGKIKVWSLSSALLGIIDQRSTRRAPTTHPWAFPVDMASRRRRQEHEASRYLIDKPSASILSSVRAGTGWRPSLRSSVLQDRLSLTDHELLQLTHSRDLQQDDGSRRSHHRPLHLRQSDVGRAVRNFVLMQAAPTSTASPRRKDQSVAGGSAERLSEEDQPLRECIGCLRLPALISDARLSSVVNLDSVLKDVEQFQLADSSHDKPRATSAMTTSKDKKETRWPVVTLASVKALAFSVRPSSSAIHCELPTRPSRKTSTRQQERYAPSLRPLETTADSFGRTREVFVTSVAHPSNQSEHPEPGTAHGDRVTAPRLERPGKNDAVLRYHVKLAHSWNPPAPR